MKMEDSKQPRVYGRFKQVKDGLDSWTLGWLKIYMEPKYVNGKRLFTLRFTIPTCIFLSRFLRTNDIMSSSGLICWMKGYKQLCEPAEACRGRFRVKGDDVNIGQF
jgi:hypothetical protein